MDINKYNNFMIVGDTINCEKYAYKIKDRLIKLNKNIHCVPKEIKDIKSITDLIEVIVLCINQVAGINLLKEYNKHVELVVIQPGAGSTEIEEYLKANNIQYINDCILVMTNNLCEVKQ
ncbi:MAG: CoA-binding protein [Anaeroplasmataceae bacterium]